jgi:RNA polymerase sigma factor (sigma-70 family)
MKLDEHTIENLLKRTQGPQCLGKLRSHICSLGNREFTQFFKTNFGYTIERLRRGFSLAYFSRDDYYQEAAIVFLKSMDHYTADKEASFATFFLSNFRHHLSDLVRKAKPVDAPLNDELYEIGGPDAYEQRMQRFSFLNALSYLDYEDLECYSLHVDGFSVRDISERIGKSTATVSRSLKTIKNTIREQM